MKFTFTSCFLVCIFSVNAQNLVPDPSFESITNPFCGIAAPADFSNTMTDWYAPTNGSTDIYFDNIAQSCYNFQPNSTYPGPIGLKGSQLPRTGNAMAGIYVYTIPGNNQREYIQIALSSPVSVGGDYIVECYVSFADFVEFSSDQLGMYLSLDPISAGTDGVLSYTPQVQAGSVISDTSGWVRIADTITVSEAYTYLTIGSFSSDANTTTVSNSGSSGEPGTYGSYYFVDDVRVERYTDPSAGIEEAVSHSFEVYPNPSFGDITISLPEGITADQIEVRDLSGRLISSVDFKEHIELGIPSGTYFLQLIHDGILIGSEKLLIH